MKDRADKVLTDLALVSSRSQAKSLIEKGDVKVNGNIIKKAGEFISPDDQIEILSPLYVGRGAFKLEKALEEFKVNIKGKNVLDIGASTGGFTEVLLNHGASLVYAIDVGHDQLSPKLRNDPRVVNMEGTNIKEVKSLPHLADVAVMDLSFISVTKVLKNIKNLLTSQAYLIALIKPQFEAGIDRLPKDGVIKDDRVRKQILDEVISFSSQIGWNKIGHIDSPIEGKSGNKEFLVLFQRD